MLGLPLAPFVRQLVGAFVVLSVDVLHEVPVFIDWEGQLSCSPRVYCFLYASKFPLCLSCHNKPSIHLSATRLSLRIWTAGPSARQWRVMSPGPTSLASFASITIFSGQLVACEESLFLTLQGFCFVTRSRLSMPSILCLVCQNGVHFVSFPHRVFITRPVTRQ